MNHAETLKFKVKLVERKKPVIYDVNALELIPDGILIHYKDNKQEYVVSPKAEGVELLMYSNYYDIHQVRICDRDIIRDVETNEIMAVKFNIGDSFVVYNPECCEYCKNEDGAIETLDFASLHNLEVIGNIFENYDLLKGEEECVTP